LGKSAPYFLGLHNGGATSPYLGVPAYGMIKKGRILWVLLLAALPSKGQPPLPPLQTVPPRNDPFQVQYIQFYKIGGGAQNTPHKFLKEINNMNNNTHKKLWQKMIQLKLGK
jgi:hypothetical protein